MSESRSIQRRKAVQRGEPMPEFDQREDMIMDKWTLEQWHEHVIVNSHNTYSMTIVFTALCIKEHGVEKGYAMVNGLSGFQAREALKLSRAIQDIDMMKV